MQQTAIPKRTQWIGRTLSAVVVLFLLFDATLKFFMDRLPPEARQANEVLQWPMELMPTVGTILFFCLFLHLIPRTSILGAVLLTGYMGGAVASHVRVGNPLFSHSLFPVYLGTVLWLGLFLRDARVRNCLKS